MNVQSILLTLAIWLLAFLLTFFCMFLFFSEVAHAAQYCGFIDTTKDIYSKHGSSSTHYRPWFDNAFRHFNELTEARSGYHTNVYDLRVTRREN